MKMVTKAAIVIGAFAAALSSVPANAQDGRLSLSFTPGVATASGDSNLALAGTVDYRFSEHLSFEGDMTWLDDAATGGFSDRNFGTDGGVFGGLTSIRVNGQPIPGQPGTGRGDNRLSNLIDRNFGNIAATIPTLNASTDGQTWIGTMGVRYEPATQTARFRPYVSGGVGVNFTDQNISIAATSITQAVNDSVSHSGLALSAGGGANVRIAGPLWVGGDAKYFRLSNERDLMRIGGSVTFKF
jgi:opacity protein-like surface antigen